MASYTFKLISLPNIFRNKRRNYIIISQLINGIIGLISGKLIAINISPSNFGQYNLEFAFLTFFSTIFLSPFLQYIKTTIKTLLTKIGYKYYLILGFILLLFCFILINLFYSIFFNKSFLSIFSIITFSYLLFNSINSVLSDYLNVENKVKIFSLFSIQKAIIGLVFLLTIFWSSSEIFSETEELWMFQLAPLVLVLFFINSYTVKSSTRIKIGFFKFARNYFAFAWPLIILAFWSWINNYFDRYVLEYYLDDYHVGLYNASYGLGSKFFLVLNPIFLIILTPFVYQNVPRTIKKDQINRFAKYYIVISSIILLIILFSYQTIGDLLLSHAYESSFDLIFWIALGYFLLTFTFLFETLFYSERQTKLILISNIISAIICISLNIVLVPLFGLKGAAISLIIGSFSRFTFTYFQFLKL